MVGLHLCMWVFCVVCYAFFERFILLFQPSIAMQLPSHIDILTFACPLISALNADYHIFLVKPKPYFDLIISQCAVEPI